MHLSDAFEQNAVEKTNSQRKPYGLELTCTVYNINPGYNEDIQRESRVLSGYTSFVEKVRSFAKEEPALQDAIERAVSECIREGILVEFFTEHHSEVVKVAALDFTFERREKLIRRDSLEEGKARGEAIGQARGEAIGQVKGEKLKLISLVCRKLKKGKTAEAIAEDLEEEISLIEAICETAEPFSPEYDERKIYDMLKTKI